MSSAGIIWVVLCIVFAVLWLTVGWFFLPILNLLFFFLSIIVMIPAFFTRRTS